ncbi:unnamed protein product [Camellia sinensis]
MPDKRVIGLIKHMGSQVNPKQKRVLCMNKVDLVEKKKDLLKVAEQFKDLPGYERGSGVKDLTQYLMEQAVKRPWDEDPLAMSEEEIPYGIQHHLVDWKELRDGSLRIELHFITHKMSQRKILVGKNGSKIGRIGIEANEELRSIFKRNVHLILQNQEFARQDATKDDSPPTVHFKELHEMGVQIDDAIKQGIIVDNKEPVRKTSGRNYGATTSSSIAVKPSEVNSVIATTQMADPFAYTSSQTTNPILVMVGQTMEKCLIGKPKEKRMNQRSTSKKLSERKQRNQRVN